jgi:hypothetical protein
LNCVLRRIVSRASAPHHPSHALSPAAILWYSWTTDKYSFAGCFCALYHERSNVLNTINNNKRSDENITSKFVCWFFQFSFCVTFAREKSHNNPQWLASIHIDEFDNSKFVDCLFLVDEPHCISLQLSHIEPLDRKSKSTKSINRNQSIIHNQKYIKNLNQIQINKQINKSF